MFPHVWTSIDHTNPSVMLPKYLDVLKKAGYDKIQTEFNKQPADWLAMNVKNKTSSIQQVKTGV